MARKLTEFSLYGVNYRSQEFSAMDGLDIMDRMDSMNPLEALSLTEVKADDGWAALSSVEIVNERVLDVAKIISPTIALKGLIYKVQDLNFGFLAGWKPIKIPFRFLSDHEPISSPTIKPIVAQLISEKLATVRELEEYYSTRDAFQMFDVILQNALNKALANEAASNKK